MRPHRLIAGVLLSAAGAAVLIGGRPAAAVVPTATTVTSVPTVGALFVPSVLGVSQLLTLPHTCSASVVHSPRHNLLLTAAHCIVGTAWGYEFVPGYHDGVAPDGVWTVTRAYVDRAWQLHQDAVHDYAFLVVAAKRGLGIEDITGGNSLGAAPASGQTVTVSGYVAGVNDRPITCTNSVYYTEAYPSFDCDGFADGTSGAPWITPGHEVVGVIGGLDRGGCTPSTSYSSPFGRDVELDWQRASNGTRSDFVLPALGSGC